MTPEYTTSWEQDPDGSWALYARQVDRPRAANVLFFVRSDHPRGFGTVTALGPGSDLEIRKGHTDVRGSLEAAVETVKALVDAHVERVRALSAAGG